MGRIAPSVIGTLCALRWLAVVTQAATVAVVTLVMGVALPVAPMAAAIALLALFNAWATWRTRRGEGIAAPELFAHIVVDVVVLAWLIGWSGGIANPFTSLFLLPIAFAALALPLRWMHATAIACGLGYAASAIFGRGLPHVHGPIGDAFDLHLIGMVVNFLVSAGVVLYFFARLASLLRARERELASLRERFARNEGIVALATHAASVAHELNTPLATLMLMLDELLDDDTVPASLHEEHRTMRQLVDVCRDRVQALAVPAAGVDPRAGAARVDLDAEIERWTLVRPAIDLERHGDMPASTRVDAAIGHLLQALLNNAADAGEAAGRPRVQLRLDRDAHGLHGEVRDFGAGFDPAHSFLPGRAFGSSKPGGLGVGLALSHATVERLGGSLSMQPAADGHGICVRFSLPMAEAA